MNRRFALRSVIFAAGAAALAACTPMMGGEGDVVDVASASGSFTTLIAAATAAEIIEPLQRQGPYTVFAPTDAAFAALPAGVVENLLLPENRDQLVAILTYHVVPGAVTAEQMTGQRMRVATINGANLQIDGRDGIRVGTASVITPDITATNGVIHAIDRVLMP